jgi:hypothetical protein
MYNDWKKYLLSAWDMDKLLVNTTYSGYGFKGNQPLKSEN